MLRSNSCCAAMSWSAKLMAASTIVLRAVGPPQESPHQWFYGTCAKPHWRRVVRLWPIRAHRRPARSQRHELLAPRWPRSSKCSASYRNLPTSRVFALAANADRLCSSAIWAKATEWRADGPLRLRAPLRPGETIARSALADPLMFRLRGGARLAVRRRRYGRQR
jgi:hypothetical protein